MRILALLACTLLLAVAFAGCSDKGKDDDGGEASSTSTSRTTSSSTSTSRSNTTTTSSTGTSSGPAVNGTNRAPTGTVSAAVNGTGARFNLTGADADGDALSWTLAFGDGNSTNGTALPAAVNHTYAVAGNFTARYVLTDGKTPSNYTVAVNVSASGSSGPLQTVSGEFQAGGFAECALGEYPEQGDDVTHAIFEVLPATVGKPFRAVITVTVPTIGPADIPGFGHLPRNGIDFVGADRAYTVTYGSDSDVVTGTVDGAPLAAAWACGGGLVEFTYVAG